MVKSHASKTVQTGDTPGQSAERPAVPSSYRTWMGYLTLVVLAVILIGFWRFSENLIGTIDRQARRVNELQRVLAGKDLRVIFLRGPDDRSPGFGKVIWNPESGTAILQTSNLPPLREDHVYQFWIFKNNEPVPIGTFTTEDGEGNSLNVFELRRLKNGIAGGYLVTLEPATGSTQPSGPAYLTGDVVASPG